MFRLVNVGGRPALEHVGGFYDVARLADDESLATRPVCLARFEELHELARRCDGAGPDGRLDEVVLGPPVPDARQVFGIGLNYKSHADESGMELPPAPLTFTKFPSCLAGPTADVTLSGAIVDYEAEVVVVIGGRCRDVAEDRAWDVVAGITAGQDISDRAGAALRLAPAVLPGQELHRRTGRSAPPSSRSTPSPNPDDIALRCEVGGEVVQEVLDGPADLRRAEARVVPVVDLHAVPRRPHLHRDPGRRRHGAWPIPRPWRRDRDHASRAWASCATAAWLGQGGELMGLHRLLGFTTAVPDPGAVAGFYGELGLAGDDAAFSGSDGGATVHLDEGEFRRLVRVEFGADGPEDVDAVAQRLTDRRRSSPGRRDRGAGRGPREPRRARRAGGRAHAAQPPAAPVVPNAPGATVRADERAPAVFAGPARRDVSAIW